MHVVNSMESEKFAIKKAILVHASGGNSPYQPSGSAFATIHSVETVDGGRPQIMAGRVLSGSDLEATLGRLNPAKRMTFIPATLLAANGSAMVWWRPPAKARVWFNAGEGDPLGDRTGITPQPGLVFAVADGKWSVWAVKGNERPGPQSLLFNAPYYNVWEGGGICVGNAAPPKVVEASAIPDYEAAFFDSRFTHSNVRRKGVLTCWRGGIGALWMSLLAGRHRTFPERALVSSGKTVEQVIDEIAGVKKRKGR